MQEIQQQLATKTKEKPLRSFGLVYGIAVKDHVRYWVIGIFLVLFGVLLLPWTQNIRAKGYITTLRQEQRPQEVNSIIAGRIVKWYVKEGDFVKAGDTIAQLAEIKDSYLDHNLLGRTQEQLTAKAAGINSYQSKVSATESQINALQNSLVLKMQQLRLKVAGDSLEALAADNDYRIATAQLRRQQIMRDSGLSSLVQLEQRNQQYQNATAKKLSAEVKYLNTRTELSQVQQEYAEKLFKAQGDKAAAQSEIASGQAEVAKLNNQYANYRIRNGLYFLIAPQSGQIIQAAKSGINEMLKEGEKIAEIIPQEVEHAVEMYIRPVDLPLVAKGQKVRFLFDGFPAIVFNGWPQASYGTFSGTVVAVESSVSPNGNFRVLVAEDKSFKPWPKGLKIGTGASGIALLKDVRVWYELWRNINGFPPEYYQANNNNKNAPAKK